MPARYLVALYYRRWPIEMVFRSLYFYLKALERGETRSLPDYLAARAFELGIVKRLRKDKTNVFDSWPLTIAADP